MLTITLSNGQTLQTDRANSTAALMFRQVLGIPMHGLLNAEKTAIEVLNRIGTAEFDEAMARAIVSIFPSISPDLVWYQDVSRSPHSSIIGLQMSDILKIAIEVVTEGTKAIKPETVKRISPLEEARSLTPIAVDPFEEAAKLHLPPVEPEAEPTYEEFLAWKLSVIPTQG